VVCLGNLRETNCGEGRAIKIPSKSIGEEWVGVNAEKLGADAVALGLESRSEEV
jgi:hypothetical protein